MTIAGQTAPGAGITLSGRIDGYSADPGGNIIIRHLRFRPPPITDEEGAVDDLGNIYDALQLGNNSNLMLDHLSFSWGSDETVDRYEFANDSTLQWSTIEQSNPQGQPEGPHNQGIAFPRDGVTLETIDDVRTAGGDWEPNPPEDLLGWVATAA